MSVESMFVTTDCACTPDADGGLVTFNMIEDEDGSTYWGYGHVDPDAFEVEVLRWMQHCGVGPEPGEPHPSGMMAQSVEHIYAYMDKERDEIFHVIDPEVAMPRERFESIFPVTRLVL